MEAAVTIAYRVGDRLGTVWDYSSGLLFLSSKADELAEEMDALRSRRDDLMLRADYEARQTQAVVSYQLMGWMVNVSSLAEDAAHFQRSLEDRSTFITRFRLGYDAVELLKQVRKLVQEGHIFHGYAPLLIRPRGPDPVEQVPSETSSSTLVGGREALQLVEGYIMDDKEDEEEDDVDDLVGNAELDDDKGMRMGGTSKDLTGSCSFLTCNDYDSSSTTTEGMCIISPNGRLRRNMGSWTRGRLLGSGSFGTVYEAISDVGFFLAVKEVSLLDQGNNAQQCIFQLEQEIALLSQFEHENIVQYYGTDKEDAKLYIFLELITQGSLASLYQKYHLRDSQVSAYTRQILNGLKYLHERNVVHRDIKCANILVDANGSVKLADFGLAKETTKLSMLKSCKGSVYWMAPEVVNPRSTYGPSADIWSLGCTVLEMLTRQIPFPNLEWTQALFLIGRGGQPTVPNTLSKDARDFIQQCVQVDPNHRPPATKLLDHPFVKRPLPSAWGSDSSTHGERRA